MSKKPDPLDAAVSAAAASALSLRLERALATLSDQLATCDEVALKDVLSTFGTAAGAQSVYLVILPQQETPLPGVMPHDAVTAWHQGTAADQDSQTETRAADVPFSLSALTDVQQRRALEREAGVTTTPLAAGNRNFGYLVVAYPDGPRGLPPAYQRAVQMLGDVLADYFLRVSPERDLREGLELWNKLVELHPQPILITEQGEIIYANAAALDLLGTEDPGDVLGRTLRDFVSAEQQAVLDQRRDALLEGRSTPLLEHEIIRLDGEERIVESISIPFQYRQAAQTILRDVTKRKESEERHRTFVEMISEAIWLIDLEKPVAVDTRCEIQVRHILQHGILRECNKEMIRLLDVKEGHGVIGCTVETLPPALGQAFIADLVRAGYHLDRYTLFIQPAHEPARHLLVNAVGTVNRGALRRIWCSCIDVTDRVKMERSIVTVLEEQQERIGRDLHDSIGQLLTGIRMLSTNLTMRYFKQTDEGYELSNKVTRFAEDAAQRLRNILRGLAPPLIYDEALTVALSNFASSIDAISDHITCTFMHEGNVEVQGNETKLQLYRIAQEATNNALKHAKAKHIWISLTRRGPRIVLQVQDDGVGFDPKAAKGKSFGMANMQHRAQSIRADLVVDSDTDAGTVIACTLEQPHPSRRPLSLALFLLGAAALQQSLLGLAPRLFLAL